MNRNIFIAGLTAWAMTSAANAGVIVGLYNSPPTTAGVAISTRSGPGTWHIYAIESASTSDVGISGYSITLSGATAIDHRSPNGFATDSEGDTQNWGFTNLRSATNANPIVAAQPLTGTSPFLITGFGQTASNATSKIHAIDAGAIGITATSGASWGNYTSLNSTTFENYSIATGRRWVFLAEGTGSLSKANISSASFTVYANSSHVSIPTSTLGVYESFDIIPPNICEPTTLVLVGIPFIGGIGLIRRQPASRNRA